MCGEICVRRIPSAGKVASTDHSMQSRNSYSWLSSAKMKTFNQFFVARNAVDFRRAARSDSSAAALTKPPFGGELRAEWRPSAAPAR